MKAPTLAKEANTKTMVVIFLFTTDCTPNELPNVSVTFVHEAFPQVIFYGSSNVNTIISDIRHLGLCVSATCPTLLLFLIVN